MIKKTFTILCILIFSFVGSIFTYAHKISNDLTSNIFRIHIIANSDSTEDQALKLKIRDNILEHFSKKNLSFNTIDECIVYYSNNIDEINKIVLATLNEYNSDYTFSTEICKSYFPTKDYDYFSLPTGTYNCLKIKIGEAVGQNWWCVLYPNLCITDIGTTQESKKLLENTVSNESYEVITNNISYKFKIVEYIEKLKSVI